MLIESLVINTKKLMTKFTFNLTSYAIFDTSIQQNFISVFKPQKKESNNYIFHSKVKYKTFKLIPIKIDKDFSNYWEIKKYIKSLK